MIEVDVKSFKIKFVKWRNICIKDLYDYDLVEKCYKCGVIHLKTNLQRNKTKNYASNSNRKVGRKQYYNEDLVKIKKYYLDNRDRMKDYYLETYDKFFARKKIYSKNKYKTDINFRLIFKTRSRIKQAVNGNSKSSSTKEFFGTDVDLYTKWIEHQFTPEMNWSNIEIDHVKPI